ncbi:MAG: rod shape-determining protein MreC [Sphingopyxis sp.]
MAIHSDDRHSYSRRAHYGAFASYVVALTGAVAGCLAATLWIVDPVGFANLRMLVAEGTAPAARAINTGKGPISDIEDSISAWWRAGSQNRELRENLTNTRRAIIHAHGLEAENAQLRRLLGLTRAETRPIAIAMLLSTSISSTRRYANIDAGFGDGVRSGQPVRSADGLIGRTLEVGPTVSRVLLITDRQNVVPAVRARDGLALLVSGRGDELLDVRALNAAGNPLKIGDVLHSSGSGGLYQPRTPIGVIVRLTMDGGLASPFADPGASVGVIVEPAANADFSEPPAPVEASTDAQSGN